MIFFTSDTHFGHENIIRYCNRPFATVEEMDKTLISNWNSVVRDGDEVYHLGDFSFGNPEYYLSALKGKINFIEGNHDGDFWKSDLWTRLRGIQKLPPIKTMGFEVDKERFTLTMCHYPMVHWNKSHHPNNWHLFGHVHNSPIQWQNPMSKNVGVDMTNFKPVDLVSLYNELKARPFESGFNYKSQ